jgi:hypothetical protein
LVCDIQYSIATCKKTQDAKTLVMHV